MSDALPIEVLVRSFLRAAHEQDVAAVVVCASIIDGKPSLRLDSNRPSDVSNRILGQVAQPNPEAIISASAFLHSRAEGCMVCDAKELHRKQASALLAEDLDLAVGPTPTRWEDLSDADKGRHIKYVCLVLEAARRCPTLHTEMVS